MKDDDTINDDVIYIFALDAMKSDNVTQLTIAHACI